MNAKVAQKARNTPDGIIRDEIRSLRGYHVPDSHGMVKLDAMENPYSLPQDLRGDLAKLVADTPLNRYPDAHARELKALLMAMMEAPAGMEILLGNGSDEIIQMLALAVAKPGAVMLGLEPSFVMFRLIAAQASLKYVGVPLNADFSIDLPATVAAIEEHEPPLVFIAYPNNPTGNLYSDEAILAIIDAAPGLVVMDEAYSPFAGGRTFMPRLSEFSNLLVMRTVSKLGLAGLRLGMLFGRNEWLQHIDKVRLPYNVNVLTQLVAAQALRHPQVLESQAAAICTERSRMLSELRRMPGVEVYASAANFILFKVGRPEPVFSGLKQRGILIKNVDGTHPLLAGCLRVTVGTPDENARFQLALAAALQAASTP